MARRWIALTLGLAILVIVGIFIGAVLWPPPAPRLASAVGADGSTNGVARGVGQAGRGTVTAEVAPAGANVVAVMVSIADADARAAGPSVRPTALLRMTDMAMDTQALNLLPEDPGRWRGSARLSMSGRWQLELDVERSRIMVPFVSLP
jgi:hypothetical protein